MADELEKTCENCKYEFESCEGEHCRHCIHSADEHFEPKIIVPTEAEIRNQVIDEFAHRIRSKVMAEIDDCADELDWIDEIAEQMKGE